jgi:hypothetical protein
MTVRNHGNLSITYLTPFQRPKHSTQPMEYALEICAARSVVLSLVWHRTSPLFIETYRPGAWEATLDRPAVTARLAA